MRRSQKKKKIKIKFKINANGKQTGSTKYLCEWFHSVYYKLFHSRPSDVYLRVKLMRDIVSLANKIIELYSLFCCLFFFQIGFEYNRYWEIVFVVAYLWLISSLHSWLLFSFNMLPDKTGTVPMLIVSIQMMFVYSVGNN